jgi:hypothetical protein
MFGTFTAVIIALYYYYLLLPAVLSITGDKSCPQQTFCSCENRYSLERVQKILLKS